MGGGLFSLYPIIPCVTVGNLHHPHNHPLSYYRPGYKCFFPTRQRLPKPQGLPRQAYPLQASKGNNPKK